MSSSQNRLKSPQNTENHQPVIKSKAMIFSPDHLSVDGSYIFRDDSSSNATHQSVQSSPDSVLSSEVRGQLIAQAVLCKIERSTSTKPKRLFAWLRKKTGNATSSTDNTLVTVPSDRSDDIKSIGGTEEDFLNACIDEGLEHRNSSDEIVERLGLGTDGEWFLSLIEERIMNHEAASRYDMTTGLCWSHLTNDIWMPHYQEYVHRNVKAFAESLI